MRLFERVRRSAFVPPHAHSRAQGDDKEDEDSDVPNFSEGQVSERGS